MKSFWMTCKPLLREVLDADCDVMFRLFVVEQQLLWHRIQQALFHTLQVLQPVHSIENRSKAGTVIQDC